MWAGHVHDHSVWADLIAPLRNQARVTCELVWAENLACANPQNQVPFGDVLLMFADYLNSEYKPHSWPVLHPRSEDFRHAPAAATHSILQPPAAAARRKRVAALTTMAVATTTTVATATAATVAAVAVAGFSFPLLFWLAWLA